MANQILSLEVELNSAHTQHESNDSKLKWQLNLFLLCTISSSALGGLVAAEVLTLSLTSINTSLLSVAFVSGTVLPWVVIVIATVSLVATMYSFYKYKQSKKLKQEAVNKLTEGVVAEGTCEKESEVITDKTTVVKAELSTAERAKKDAKVEYLAAEIAKNIAEVESLADKVEFSSDEREYQDDEIKFFAAKAELTTAEQKIEEIDNKIRKVDSKKYELSVILRYLDVLRFEEEQKIGTEFYAQQQLTTAQKKMSTSGNQVVPKITMEDLGEVSADLASPASPANRPLMSAVQNCAKVAGGALTALREVISSISAADDASGAGKNFEPN